MHCRMYMNQSFSKWEVQYDRVDKTIPVVRLIYIVPLSFGFDFL
jgi:hypothetical protein